MFFARGGENMDRVGWNTLFLLGGEIRFGSHVPSVEYQGHCRQDVRPSSK
jgi:hypothetical protein